jgi:hypothetical protein
MQGRAMPRISLFWSLWILGLGAFILTVFLEETPPAVEKVKMHGRYQHLALSRLRETNVIEAIRVGAVDLSYEFAVLYDRCDNAPAECVAKMTGNTPAMSRADIHLVTELFEKYGNYRRELKADLESGRVNFSTKTDMQEYAKARFDESSYRAIFGYRDALTKWQEIQIAMIAGASGEYSSSPQSIDEFRKAQQEVLGQYYPTFAAAEPAESAYGYEVMLAQKDLLALPEEIQSQQIRQIQARHFTPTQIVTMEFQKQEDQLAEDADVENVEYFLREEKKLRVNNPLWSAETLKAETEKLRAEIIRDRLP